MLSKSVVKKFRERELDSYRWMKKLKRIELIRMIDNLEPKPEFISKKKMWKHQLVAFLVGVYIGHFLFFLDMGLGKTRVVLEVIAYLKKKGTLKKPALIVVPNDAAIESWDMEVQEHRRDLKCIPMFGNTKQRWRLLKEKGDLFVINYSGLLHMCCILVPVEGKRSRKNKMVVDQKMITKLAERFQFICLDECTAIMNHNSLTFKVCKWIGRYTDNRYGMAGLPFGKDPHSLWAQFNFCDNGETLGTTLAIFREALFRKTENPWSGFYDYKFNKKHKKLLRRMLENRSIHYREGECRDMPARVYKPVYVPFTEDMKAYYNKVVEKLKKDKRNLRLTRNSYLQMRQIASGFISLTDDETGAKAQIEFPKNPKLEAMMQVIYEIPDGQKFLIFYEYIWTGNRISKELVKHKIPHLRLKGKQKNRPQVLREFIEDNSIPGLVLSNRIGAFALNLQKANHEIFVESPVSPIVRRQAEKRIHRGTQKKRCFYTDLIMRRNTADETVQKYLAEGLSLEKALLSGKVKFNLEKVK